MVLKCRGAQALRQQVRRIVGSLQKTKYQAAMIDLLLDPLKLDLQMTRFLGTSKFLSNFRDLSLFFLECGRFCSKARSYV